MTATLTPGTRVQVTTTAYGTLDGETGTVAVPGPVLAEIITRQPGLADTVWVYLDTQAEYAQAHPQYAKPEPVGFDPGELVTEQDAALGRLAARDTYYAPVG